MGCGKADGGNNYGNLDVGCQLLLSHQQVREPWLYSDTVAHMFATVSFLTLKLVVATPNLHAI